MYLWDGMNVGSGEEGARLCMCRPGSPHRCPAHVGGIGNNNTHLSGTALCGRRAQNSGQRPVTTTHLLCDLGKLSTLYLFLLCNPAGLCWMFSEIPSGPDVSMTNLKWSDIKSLKEGAFSLWVRWLVGSGSGFHKPFSWFLIGSHWIWLAICSASSSWHSDEVIFYLLFKLKDVCFHPI